MTAMILVAMLLVGLIVAALGGPWLLRRAAPALVHIPRLAVLMLTGSIALWLVALLAVGPMLAWVISGPVLLPGHAAEVCQRCLASANPFTNTTLDTSVPVVALLAVPTLAAIGVLLAAVREGRRRDRTTNQAASPLRARATATSVHGHTVLVVQDSRRFAFTLPTRHGGIVISDTALAALSGMELVGVIEHERAHVSQHHHVITTIVESVARHLRWVPLIAAAADATPHYLEIAADNAARGHAGTPALASALLKLGEPTHPPFLTAPPGSVLNAAGPNRISHLVNPGHRQGGTWPAVIIGTYLATLAIVNAAVHLPYLGAAITGCV